MGIEIILLPCARYLLLLKGILKDVLMTWLWVITTENKRVICFGIKGQRIRPSLSKGVNNGINDRYWRAFGPVFNTKRVIMDIYCSSAARRFCFPLSFWLCIFLNKWGLVVCLYEKVKNMWLMIMAVFIQRRILRLTKTSSENFACINTNQDGFIDEEIDENFVSIPTS